MSLVLGGTMVGRRAKLLASLLLRVRMSAGVRTSRTGVGASTTGVGSDKSDVRSVKSHAEKGWSAVVLKRDMKVCIVGASGCVGSKVALLLKISRLVDWLSLHDVKRDIYGVAMDLSHISTKTQVFGYQGDSRLQEAMLGSHVVIICASEPRTPQMTVGDMFEANASMMVEIANTCIETCPKACVLVVTQPVESLVPLIAQVYRHRGVYDPRKLIGVTSANVIRSISMLSRFVQCNPLDIIVPVLGGHSPGTIVPIFSSSYPDPVAIKGRTQKRAALDRILAPYRVYEPNEIVKASIHDMNHVVRSAEDNIFQVKQCMEGASITGAAATTGTAIKVIVGLSTNEVVVDHAYVETNRVEGVTYSTIPVQYGPVGVWKQYTRLPLSRTEQGLMADAVKLLKANIKEGEDYANSRNCE